MKKVRGVPMEPSPSSSSYPGGEEARARFKHMSLLQDYVELMKETEAKRKRSLKAKQNKLKLLAEVKFLRRKFKCLSQNPSQTTQYKLKKQTQEVPHSWLNGGHLPNQIIHDEVRISDTPSNGKEVATPRTSAVIDLNQVLLPNGEEMEEFHVNWEPVKANDTKKCLMEGETVANDLKLSVCRDVGNGANRVRKRKITWQDQVALKV
ncbi:uncharacterized protein [Typha angustifolia]|uniref:uncharacterized protein n=1 Tax=Typha angustifolia TaxID=59011 RepID=UPI003C2E38A1